MPELPEVETTLRGIKPRLIKQTISAVTIREPRLRWPVPKQLATLMQDQVLEDMYRRAKYLVFDLANGHMLVHLGMSGSLRIVDTGSELRKHDHVEWQFNNGKSLRLHDPRRFGSVHWHAENVDSHPLLSDLGPEPLAREFNGKYLFLKSRKRQLAVKNFIMDAKIVVGVGNIYASEALFDAGIHPLRPVNRISAERYDALSKSIKKILRAAIKQGGTTLRDFVNDKGNPGYFRQQLNVYDKAGQACKHCNAKIKKQIVGQRSTFFCSRCQR